MYPDGYREERNVAVKKPSRPKGKGKAVKKRQREASSKTVDQRLIKALAHPLRVQILAILNDRMASPKELSRELEGRLEPGQLPRQSPQGLRRASRWSRPSRAAGPVEHYYRASSKVFMPCVDDEADTSIGAARHVRRRPGRHRARRRRLARGRHVRQAPRLGRWS